MQRDVMQRDVMQKDVMQRDVMQRDVMQRDVMRKRGYWRDVLHTLRMVGPVSGSTNVPPSVYGRYRMSIAHRVWLRVPGQG